MMPTVLKEERVFCRVLRMIEIISDQHTLLSYFPANNE